MHAAMKSRVTRRCALAVVVLAGVSLYGADYLTEGVDNGRTGWLKNEKTFNTANVRTCACSGRRRRTARHGRCTTCSRPGQGRRANRARTDELAIFAGISDEIFAYDVNHGELVAAEVRQHLPAGDHR